MPLPISELPPHLGRFVENTRAVSRLTEIHEQLAGKSPGRKYGVEVLNKSALVLLVACWESFIETLATSGFDAIHKHARAPDVFPNKVLAVVGKALKQDQNDTKVWMLAGKGWRQVLLAHRDEVLDRYVGKLNTPKPEQINALFKDLLGVNRLTQCWSYQGMSPARAESKLTELVVLRGDIAHKVKTTRSVKKSDVEYYINFIGRLAGLSSNRVGAFVAERIHWEPWSTNIQYES